MITKHSKYRNNAIVDDAGVIDYNIDQISRLNNAIKICEFE